MTGEGQRLSRRRLVQLAGAGGAALLFPSLARADSFAARVPLKRAADGVVLRWNAAAVQGVRDSRLGPPMVARALSIVHTCIYDAWAAYDRAAAGTQFGRAFKRPPAERTPANKQRAISFAAYRAAVDLFPGDKATVFDPLMAALGYDPADRSTDPTTPTGIGNRCAQAVLDVRHHDGANQLGDEPGGTSGVAYSDYTGFAPRNAPMDLRAPFDRATVHDPNAWQPLRYVDASGVLVTPAFVGPHWNRVSPFALPSDSALRSPTGPALFGSAEYVAQAQELLDVSAALADEQKVIAEYWADGPHSELPPGHWDLFAQAVSRRDHHEQNEHGLDLDVKLFFALTNTIADAGICAWDNKRTFDSVRPVTAIRYLFQGQRVRAWAGPGRGAQTIRGEDWFPYQPTTFPTPPFPEYSSGHSNFSAAGAEILRLFTRKEDFGASVTIPAGSSKVEPGITPARDLTLSWATFQEAADQAGISRRYGGIHFEQGDLDARATGRIVARHCWDRAQALFNGETSG
ncbi:MAG TPA: vanadium-dependent haloperoxidase [Gaiellaceae bacterium]